MIFADNLRYDIMFWKRGDGMSEDLMLRILTGRIVGYFMMRELNRVAFVSMNNDLSISLASAAASSFIDKTGGWTSIYVLGNNSYSEILEDIEVKGIQAIFLAFGGDVKGTVLESLSLFLKEIALRNIEVDIILHLEAYIAGGIEKAIEDKDIKFYLQGSNNLYVYTADFDEGFLVLSLVVIHDEHIHLEEIEKFPLTLEHTRLLNRELLNRVFLWKKED